MAALCSLTFRIFTIYLQEFMDIILGLSVQSVLQNPRKSQTTIRRNGENKAIPQQESFDFPSRAPRSIYLSVYILQRVSDWSSWSQVQIRFDQGARVRQEKTWLPRTNSWGGMQSPCHIWFCLSGAYTVSYHLTGRVVTK